MKKKKFLCFFLVLILCFSSTISAYASSGSHGGGGTSIDETENNTSLAEKIGGSLGKIVGKLFVEPFEFATDFTESVNSGLDSVISEHLPDWLEKGYIQPTTDGYELLPECTKVIDDYLQSKIRELDGCWIVTPSFNDPTQRIVNYWKYTVEQKEMLDSFFRLSNHNITMYNGYYYGSYYVYPSNTYFYFDKPSRMGYALLISCTSDNSKIIDWVDNNSGPKITYSYSNSLSSYDISDKEHIEKSLKELSSYTCGQPFKVFKSIYYASKFQRDGKSYVPQVPLTVKIPKKYIDDPTLLPDITYNVDKSNKTENTIQNEYNTIINNYITNLGGSSSGGSGSGGSSGGGNITDTELYDFLTKLWNESDKKFDKMIDLLETNNKYQKKLVDSLNDIKAILVTEAVFNAFKDRSSQTADKAKDKFPTSIPWDVAMVINAMSAEPEQLKFSLPIQVKSIGINETIDIDLSSEEWEKLAKTCRYLLSITFILFLIHLTRKMFSGGDD